MIEAYAFLAVFSVQILMASVLSPARFIRYVRGWATNFGSERFAQLYPGVDYGRSIESFVAGYRVANIVIAIVGVFMLGWLFTLTRQPNWAGEVIQPTVSYFFLQMSPLVVISLFAVVRYYKVLMHPTQDPKRKASLQRRGLYDFVSPTAVVVAVASYPLFVLYSIYLDLYVYDNVSLSKQCLSAIGGVTLIYALNSFVVYKFLYGKKNPLMTNEGRVHTIGVRVKGSVYGSIAVVWFIAIFGTLGQPNLQEWKPLVLSAFFVITAILGLIDVTPPPHKSEVDRLDTSPAP